MLRTSDFMGHLHDMLLANASHGKPLDPEPALAICRLISILKIQCEAMERRLAGDPDMNVIIADNVVYMRAWAERNRRDFQKTEESKP